MTSKTTIGEREKRRAMQESIRQLFRHLQIAILLAAFARSGRASFRMNSSVVGHR
jgi:hypothetical protein